MLPILQNPIDRTGLHLRAVLVSIFFLSAFASIAQVNTGGTATTANHQKQIIGYLTNWDAWKAAAAGVPAQGALNHLNIDYSKYTVLNYSFFGVADDGSLHSGDFRNKNIYQSGAVQDPADIFDTDTYSSWDLHLLFGELDLIQYIDQTAVNRATAQGFQVTLNGSTWSNPTWGLYNKPLPLPLHKEGGAPGVLELAHSKGVKVVASIGGWSMCKHYPQMAADATMRQRFVNDCVKLINTGFDGIDLDWEFVGPFAGMNFTGTQADFVNFTNLIQAIRNAIGPNKLITAALPADPNKLQGFEWTKLNSLMNYYNIMSYDFNGGWSNKAGHNAPIYNYTNSEAPTFNWDACYNALMTLGVPASKINMGSPFYGRGVVTFGNATLNATTVKQNVTVQPDGPISTCADYTNWPQDVYDGTPLYFFIKQKALAAGSGWTRTFDSQAKVPYLTKGSYFLSYDDEESIGYKAQYINDKGLAGTIVWTVFGDLEISGTATQFGTKLLRYSNVSSVLVNKLNEVFASGGTTNNPPTVSITSPTSGASFTAPASITINANAADAGGSVSKVDFYNGTTLLGTDTSSPYSFSWTNVAAGTYTLTAKATDNTNLTATSAAVTVTVTAGSTQSPYGGTVRNIPGRIEAEHYDLGGEGIAYHDLTTGNSGNAFRTDNVDIEATTDTGAGYNVGWIQAGEWMEYTVNVTTAGAYTLSARVAATAAGHTFHVEMDGINVSGTITVPNTTGWQIWQTVNVTTTSLTTGQKVMRIYADQSDFNINYVDFSSSGNPAPTTNITSPATGAIFTAPATINIAANAADTSPGTVSKVDFYNGSTLLGTDTSAPYTFSWTNVAAGSYTLTTKATDNQGAVGTSAAVTITVNTATNQAPTTSITSPTNGATFTAPASITINANASDDVSVSKVDFYNGSTLLGTDTSSPYSFSWTNVAAGTYTLTTKATDNQGAVGTSAAISITVSGSTGTCTGKPTYVENGGYVAGSQVQNVGNLYECKPYPYTGWCNGAAWAYAPGTGTYWTDAWILKGSCSGRMAQEEADTFSEVKGMLVSPNPGVSGRPHTVTISFESDAGNVNVLLHSINGLNVMSSSHENVKRSLKVDMPALTHGLYIMRVQGSSKMLTAKYVVD